MARIVIAFVFLFCSQVNGQQQQQTSTTTTTTESTTSTTPRPTGGPIQAIINPFAQSAQGIFHGVFELGKGIAGVLQNTVNSIFDSWTYPNFRPPPPVNFDQWNQALQAQLMNQMANQPQQSSTTPRPTQKPSQPSSQG